MNIEISNEAKLPTKHGHFILRAFKQNHKEHLAIYTPSIKDNPLVRIHSECVTGDVLGSLKCDCGEQLDAALDLISKDDAGGVLIYLRQEGRDIGLLGKINAYNLQDKGLDTIEANLHLGFEADERSYEIANYILSFLGIKSIRLLTNNPDKLAQVDVKINERVPLIIKSNKYNEQYLNTKKTKSGHLFS